jgi:hypothetical protein
MWTRGASYSGLKYRPDLSQPNVIPASPRTLRLGNPEELELEQQYRHGQLQSLSAVAFWGHIPVSASE